jgi:hypothetical protein
MAGLREWLQGPSGKFTAVALCVIALVAAGYSIFFGDPNPAAVANEVWYVDSQTGKPYRYTPTMGETLPARSPSGNTGYPAELCFWTKDGTPKAEPTPVLLNRWVGKQDPTFCPDCDRLVVGRNPPAAEGRRPPPTRAEVAQNPNRYQQEEQ